MWRRVRPEWLFRTFEQIQDAANIRALLNNFEQTGIPQTWLSLALSWVDRRRLHSSSNYRFRIFWTFCKSWCFEQTESRQTCLALCLLSSRYREAGDSIRAVIPKFEHFEQAQTTANMGGCGNVFKQTGRTKHQKFGYHFEKMCRKTPFELWYPIPYIPNRTRNSQTWTPWRHFWAEPGRTKHEDLDL